MNNGSGTVRVTDVETAQIKAVGDGDIVFELGTADLPTPYRSVITLGGLAWAFTVAPSVELLMQVNIFDNATFRTFIMQNGFGAVYFNPGYQFVLDITEDEIQQLIITLGDPGSGGGNFSLNLLGYSIRSFVI